MGWIVTEPFWMTSCSASSTPNRCVGGFQAWALLACGSATRRLASTAAMVRIVTDRFIVPLPDKPVQSGQTGPMVDRFEERDASRQPIIWASRVSLSGIGQVARVGLPEGAAHCTPTTARRRLDWGANRRES